MKDKKDLDWFNKEMEDIQSKHLYFSNIVKGIRPRIEALKAMAVYIFAGVMWIILSDKALLLLTKDTESILKLQIYKGWIYVILTGIILYFVVKGRANLFNKSTKSILKSYEELTAAHEELIAMEEELHQQFNELKKHRDALNISNQRYELVVEGANDGIWDWEIKTGTYHFSIKWKKVLGYRDDELENTFEAWKGLLHSHDKESAVKKIQDYLLSNQGVYQNTYRLKCKNAGYRWILSRGKGIWDESGQAVRVAGSHTDITDLIDLQESLHKERVLSQSIIKGAPVLIIGLDSDGNILEFNPYIESLTGYTKEEAIGKNWYDNFIMNEKKEYTKQVVQEAFKGKTIKNQENQMVTKKGNIIDILWSNSPLYDINQNVIGMIATGIDITKRKEMENKLYLLAYYDTLTGLPNRQFFEKEIGTTIKKSIKEKTKFMLIYIDLDNFKNVNDTLGHNYGDMLIQKISEELRNTLKNGVTIARLGGDEFGIILPWGYDMIESSSKIMEIMDTINRTWVIDDNELYISSSLGVVIYPEDGLNVNTLLKNADTAMYVAKDSGKKNYAFYSPEMNEKALNYMAMEKETRRALSNDEFTLYYQPIVDLASNKIIAVEGLIRWIHPTKGIISPASFIPFAEESGLIIDIGEKVICMACEQLKKWQTGSYSNIKIAINISARQLMQSDLIESISYHIKDKGVNSKDLILEITENAALVNFDQSINILSKLKDMGIKIALDDFGTGYSSLNYLKQLPVDIVKMDKTFIDDISRDNEKFIVKTVIDLAHNLKLSVTGEGIETIAQLQVLSDYKCDTGQGYYYSKPISPKELEKHLKSQS